MTVEEPQTQVTVIPIPVDVCMSVIQSLITEVTLLSVPDNVNYRMELLGVGIRANVIPVDAGDAATVSIEWVDDSNGDAVADLEADFNLLTIDALVYNQIWRGSQLLDPGDSVNAEFTVATPTTASQGASLIVESRILQRS